MFLQLCRKRRLWVRIFTRADQCGVRTVARSVVASRHLPVLITRLHSSDTLLSTRRRRLRLTSYSTFTAHEPNHFANWTPV